MTTPNLILPPPMPDTGPLETMARAIETRLDMYPAVDASQGFIRQVRAGWLAEDVMVALSAAGYAIVPVEPTPEMAKVGVFVAQTGAVLGAWEAMVRAAPFNSEKGE